MTTILVIDDDGSYRELIKCILEEHGHEIFEADNVDFGQEMIENVKPDILITDIFMPKKDGLEIILETRKTSTDIKILAISGSMVLDKNKYLDFAKSFGSDACLGKPFTASELVNTVNDMLQLN